MGVPAKGRPTPIWKSLESCRRVTLPPLSTLSVRTRKWLTAIGVPGRAFVPGVEGRLGSLALPGPVGPFVVVVADEAIDLGLQSVNRSGRALLGQEPFQGLVPALDLAAGLGMVGPGVLGEHAVALEHGLSQAAPVAVGGGEDGPVEFQREVKPLWRDFS